MMTVQRLCDLYLSHADGYYRKPKSRRRTSEYDSMKEATVPLLAVAGDLPAQAVTPQVLSQARDWLLTHRTNNSRGTVNAKISRIKRVFRWGAQPERGYVPTGVYAQLATLSSLPYGRCSARETEGIKDVESDRITDLLATLFDPPSNGQKPTPMMMFARRRLATMIELQRETGMRPGELCAMTLQAIDTNGPGGTWLYRPYEHKTEHRGKQRVIVLFEPARNLIARWTANQTAGASGDRGDRGGRLFEMRVDSYRTALHRALKRASQEPITPQQFRHTAATEVRRDHGLDAAQILLGHSSSRTTEGYAHIRLEEVVKSVQEQRGL